MLFGGAAGAAQARAAGTRLDARSKLGVLTTPALVLWGDQEALVPVATGRALANSLPDARFHMLENCGIECKLTRATG